MLLQAGATLGAKCGLPFRFFSYHRCNESLISKSVNREKSKYKVATEVLDTRTTSFTVTVPGHSYILVQEHTAVLTPQHTYSVILHQFKFQDDLHSRSSQPPATTNPGRWSTCQAGSLYHLFHCYPDSRVPGYPFAHSVGYCLKLRQLLPRLLRRFLRQD